MIYWNTGSQSFEPTTINWGESQKRTACKRIVENASNTDLEVMFEGANLITTDINVKSISDEVTRVMNTPESKGKEEHCISKWKTIQENARKRVL